MSDRHKLQSNESANNFVAAGFGSTMGRGFGMRLGVRKLLRRFQRSSRVPINTGHSNQFFYFETSFTMTIKLSSDEIN